MSKSVEALSGLAAWLECEALRHDQSIARNDRHVKDHVYTLRIWAQEVKALSIQQEADAKCKWLPIESSPQEKDVLCYLPNGMKQVLGCFDGLWSSFQEPDKLHKPTHWMELPPAPNTAMATPTDSEEKTSA